jgi:predicted RNA binding protein YcfA (HicA-like mRNA interferase family)
VRGPHLVLTFRAGNGKQVIARLKAHGWIVVRIHGSHHILAKDGRAVPVRGTRDLGAGLLATLQRQTGVS